MVETAVSMLVMLMLFFGVVEASLAIYSFEYIASAAHAATRYAIVRGGTWTSSCDGISSPGSGYGSSMCTASTSDVQNYVVQHSTDFPDIKITTSDVCVEYRSSVPSSASSNCTTSTGSTTWNSLGDIVQVTIVYPFTINLPGLPNYSFSLSSTSQMVIAQ
jgi:Flp pilus assembly protein TadG